MTRARKTIMVRGLEQVLGRLDRLPWCALYRLTIGFCVVPAFVRYRGAASADWRRFPFFVLVLLTLRLVPIALRRLLPFSETLQAQWFRQRLLAKRYDSYQWSKLMWFGLGLALYVELSDGTGPAPVVLATACLLLGALGLVTWRRHLRTEGATAASWQGLRSQ